MTEKVTVFMKQHQMLRVGDAVVIGLSGGADSVCLLHILCSVRASMDLKLLAVHVSHGIRGESAQKDAAFCEDLCKRMDVPFRLIEADIPGLSKQTGKSLEEAGRNFRYETFERILEEEQFDKIAVAHHADDNAETVIANLCRGTGLSGAGGISAVCGALIRPLLCVRREEIEAYLKQIGQPFCHDETNDDMRYTRNRIRHVLIPQLEAVNAQAVSHINEAARIFREAEDYAARQTLDAARGCLRLTDECGARVTPAAGYDTRMGSETETGSHKSGQVQARIDLKVFRTYDPFVQERLLLSAMEEVCGCRRDLGSVHVKSLLTLITRQSGRRVDLPYGMQAVREYDVLRIYRPQELPQSAAERNIPKRELKDGFHTTVPLPAGEFLIPKRELIDGFHTTVPLPAGELTIDVFPAKGANFVDLTEALSYTKYLDCDKITQCLCIRTCRPDDVIGIDDLGHHKSVRRYLTDCKVPAAQRGHVMAAADGDRIVWILGGRIGREYRLLSDTAHVLKLELNGEC